MRVDIAAEQQDLEEEHAGGPDGRGSAEPGQDGFRQHRLDLEKKESSQKNGYSVLYAVTIFPSGGGRAAAAIYQWCD
ncbi:MAG: hypothetical protein A3J70_12075 [Elusimicrobia bacterium RIFCSPHIGHO2_02_FULL_61_10]|nr:MAG: hypothetical protein A3J70_12075 [Elusimicrobia bacterium RIFCSPHIGHO2_02_FULL_61_10]